MIYCQQKKINNNIKTNTMDEEKCCDDGCTCQSETPTSGTVHYAQDYSNSRPSCNEDCDEPMPHNSGRMHDLVIKQMDYGFLVKVGCQTLCIESKTNLIALFTEYVKNPQRVMNLYNEQKLVDLYIEHRLNEVEKRKARKEVRPQVNIGVVGASLDDVKKYLADIVPLAVRGATALRKYMLETPDHILYYYAITNVGHTRAMRFDRVVETHRARDNREFPQIMEAITHTIKSQKS
jgi:hypothetical protein